MKRGGIRRKRLFGRTILFTSVVFFIGFGLLLLTLRSVDDPNSSFIDDDDDDAVSDEDNARWINSSSVVEAKVDGGRLCATVEEMGSEFDGGFVDQSLRVRDVIRRHFHLNGAAAVRELAPEAFCRRGYVLGKTAEAGFGNEMYKILTSGALSIIPGIYWGKYPFGDYIAYSNDTFTLTEVKHLWRQKGCVKKYGRRLVMRLDDFEKPAKSNVLCSNWKKWEEAIIWFQGTTDAVASQFFLKNVHPEMRAAAVELFGEQGNSAPGANVFGELMMSLISPTKDVKDAVDWVLRETGDPDISLHMRMLMSKSVRPLRAAVNCLGKAINRLGVSKPRVVIVSDTPSVVKNLELNISSIAEVLHFDYKLFRGDIAQRGRGLPMLDFRIKDWGPAPRWVAFVDFFLACRAKRAVISGAHKRVGTTYAQLVAALAAANSLEDGSSNSSFAFLSSFQSNLLADGLKNQVGWGHVWNRYAGPLSCPKQPNQCAFTPLAPPGWWDGLWQSPIPRDARKLAAYGVELSGFGTVNEDRLHAFCNAKKAYLSTVTIV
ncbi:BnaA06g32530D [Brassica napus]|uniref:BnaA06g32530D protein n=1 Tax=Brassica napus TaxID=3708 RepID=A0A078FGX1_BRANA|nr:BnaA06g32530D [Brassica napus]